MKTDLLKYLISFSLLVIQTHAIHAESRFSTSDYMSMTYLIIPFDGTKTDLSPKLGFISTKNEYNYLHDSMGPYVSRFSPLIHNRNLIHITYDLRNQQWSRFTVGNLNALDPEILNVSAAGINPLTAAIGAGLAVGGVVLSSATNSDSGNHMCEEEHHEEEGHAEFAYFKDIVFNFHPCPEEEEGGHEEEGH